MGRKKIIEYKEQPYDVGDDVTVIVRYPVGHRPAMMHNDREVIIRNGGDAAAPAWSAAHNPSEQSFSNTDNRGLGATRGSGDPVKALAEGVVAPAPLNTGAKTFLDRVEENVIAQELGSIEEVDATAPDNDEAVEIPS